MCVFLSVHPPQQFNSPPSLLTREKVEIGRSSSYDSVTSSSSSWSVTDEDYVSTDDVAEEDEGASHHSNSQHQTGDDRVNDDDHCSNEDQQKNDLFQADVFEGAQQKVSSRKKHPVSSFSNYRPSQSHHHYHPRLEDQAHDGKRGRSILSRKDLSGYSPLHPLVVMPLAMQAVAEMPEALRDNKKSRMKRKIPFVDIASTRKMFVRRHMFGDCWMRKLVKNKNGENVPVMKVCRLLALDE